jgi:hypothetical protein
VDWITFRSKEKSMSARPARLLFIGCGVLCLALCLGAGAEAQSRIGVTTGLNWSSLKGDAPEDAGYGRALGVNAGIIGDLALTKDVVLSFQPTYTQRGADISFDVGEDEPRDSLELRLDYVDCLVMVKVLADNGYSYFTTGVGFGFLTQATLKDIRAGRDGRGGSLSGFRRFRRLRRGIHGPGGEHASDVRVEVSAEFVEHGQSRRRSV